MAFKSILLTSLITASATFAQDYSCPYQSPTPSIWKSAYSCDWALCHKQYLVWEIDSFDDMIHKQLFLAYAHYRAGDIEQAHAVFEFIDSMIKRELVSPLCKE
jgi:hypothetical protein